MPIKFRCYQCMQLLKTSRAKAGAVVTCPKCGVELLVPPPAPGTASVSHSGDTDPDLGGIPEDLINLRPEDIRVQPGVEVPPHTLVSASEPGGWVAETIQATVGGVTRAAVQEPEPLLPSLKIEPEPIRPDPVGPQPAPTAVFPAAAPSPLPLPTVVSAPAPPASAGSAPPLPPLEIEPQPILAPAASESRSATYRARDVALPRSAVVLWLLFVILALTAAFGAGLLVGHFLWTTAPAS
jgi:DNA-directed RNA polymerase subunit RPC12/RpoP